jgi:hypothetical protein
MHVRERERGDVLLVSTNKTTAGMTCHLGSESDFWLKVTRSGDTESFLLLSQTDIEFIDPARPDPTSHHNRANPTGLACVVSVAFVPGNKGVQRWTR